MLPVLTIAGIVRVTNFVGYVNKQDATLSQGVPRDAAVNFGATGIIDIKKPMDRHITAGNASSKVH